MILLQGITSLSEDIKDDMTNGQAGTSTTLFAKTQTSLQTAVGATEVALADKKFSANTVSVTHLLSVSVGNSNTLTEFEVNNGTISYNRSVKAGVAKTSDIELTTLFTFTFEVFA